MSFQSAIPWQVALRQSLPPLHRPETILNNQRCRTIIFRRVCSVTFLNEATRRERIVDARQHIDKSSLSLRPLPVLEVNLYDQNRSPIGNMEAIVRQELDLMKSEKLNQKHIEHTFDTPTFLGPESTPIPLMKRRGVTL